MGVKGDKAQARRDVSKLGTSRVGLSSSYLGVSAGLTSIKELKGKGIGGGTPLSVLKAILLWRSIRQRLGSALSLVTALSEDVAWLHVVSLMEL